MGVFEADSGNIRTDVPRESTMRTGGAKAAGAVDAGEFNEFPPTPGDAGAGRANAQKRLVVHAQYTACPCGFSGLFAWGVSMGRGRLGRGA